MYEYDVQLRPNYESRAAGVWLLSGAATVATPFLTYAPAEPFWAMTSVCALMAARRAPKAYRLWKMKRDINGRPLAFVKLPKLLKILKRHQKSLWLGYGFEWDQKQTQLAFDIMKRSKQEIGITKREPEATGVPWIHGIGAKEIELSQPLKHTEGHWLIAGTTGSGKSRCFDQLITQAVLRDEPVVIIDPKGDKDLRDNARIACEQIGQPEKFVYFHPGFPDESFRIDPMYNFNRATELATRIAVLIPSESGADPFTAFGQMSLNNIVQGILLAGDRPNLVAIRSYLEGGTDGLVIRAIAAYCDSVMPDWEYYAGSFLSNAGDPQKKALAMVNFYRQKVKPKKPNSDLEGLISMFMHDREHFQKMVASLLPVLSMLTSGDLGPLLSPDPNDFDDMRPITDMSRALRNNQVVYIGLDSLTDSMVGSAIGSMLLSDLVAVAGDRYNYGDGNYKSVNIFVDEAAEVINNPMIQALNKGRGAGFRLFVATQTFADFAAKLGDEAKARQVLGNINNLLTLRITDAETQKYICDSLPETSVRWVMTTQATNSASTAADSHSGNIGERLMEEQVPMIPSQLLGLLPNLEFFARLVDGRLIKGRLPILLKET